MAFERHDRVRVLHDVDGVPPGTEGVVIGVKAQEGVYVVQFGGYGTHDIPATEVEAVDRPETD